MSSDPRADTAIQTILAQADFSKLEEALCTAIANGTSMVMVHPDMSGTLAGLQITAFTIDDLYDFPEPAAACEDLSYLEDPKYKRLLAQYERAKLQRNKHLMRDLERQLQGYRWRY